MLALTAGLWGRLQQFNDITLRQTMPGSAHVDTKSIYLQGPQDPTPERWYEDVPHIAYKSLIGWSEAQSVISRIMQLCHGPLGKVMIVALRPGGKITPHVDEGAYANAYDRYHLPISTNPTAEMFAGGETQHIPVGQLTWFNNHVLHSACNMGAFSRVHLIVDVRRKT